MEKWTRLSAGLAASIIFLDGTALVPDKPAGCERGGAPEKLEGQVIKIDPERRRRGQDKKSPGVELSELDILQLPRWQDWTSFSCTFPS